MEFSEFFNTNLTLLPQSCTTPWLEHSMLDLHWMFLKVASLKRSLKNAKETKMSSLDPQSNYLVTAQLLTRILFLLLREFSIQLTLLCKLKPVWFWGVTQNSDSSENSRKRPVYSVPCLSTLLLDLGVTVVLVDISCYKVVCNNLPKFNTWFTNQTLPLFRNCAAVPH